MRQLRGTPGKSSLWLYTKAPSESEGILVCGVQFTVMGKIQRRAWPVLAVPFFVMLLSVLSVPAFAQETELSKAIRTSLLADPRSQNLSEEELASMVEALTAAAMEQKLTAEDIAWRPEEPESETASVPIDTCGNLPKFLCMLNESFGFSSGNLMIPILLFVSSLALLFVLGLMTKMHRHEVSPGISNNQPQVE